jgi:hypothetical protein
LEFNFLLGKKLNHKNIYLSEKNIKFILSSRGGAEVARWAHNPKVVGSIPAPATKKYYAVNI